MPEDSQSIQSSERFRVTVLATKNLSVLVTGTVAIVALWKARQEDIPKIVETLVSSNAFAAIGWTLAIVFLLGSVVSIKLLIRGHDKEVIRLSKERDELQRRLLDK